MLLFFFHLCSSTWSLWQIRLQQHLVLYTLEKQTLKQRDLTLQRTVKTRVCYDCCSPHFIFSEVMCGFLILLLFVFLSLVKDMASLERNAQSGLLPERERIKNHTSLHPQTEKEDVSPLGNLCGSSPNQEKVARLSFYTSYKAQSYLSSCSYSNILSLLFFFVLFFVVALAQRVCRVRLVRTFWRTWSSALHHKWREEDRSRAIGFLAVQSTQRRALEYWKACILNIKKTLFFFMMTAAS